ncbi:MAG: DUF1819 family protein [Deltaproteobacteria bacterium]|nr:DUF1819 family protein [Deltaproteobacteria bacterium]
MAVQNKNNRTKNYTGDIVAGSLLITESRKIAQLLLNKVNDDQWHQAIIVDNVLQKRSPIAAKRQAQLIKNRLTLMKPDLWELICKGNNDVSVQALLSAAIKYSRLVGDFLDQVVREHWRTFKPAISVKDWKYFIEICAQSDPHVLEWTESTYAKLKQVVFRILAESHYINSTRSGQIQPVIILPEIRKYLTSHSEWYVLRCMQATQ